MTKRFSFLVILSLLLIAFLTMSVLAAKAPVQKDPWKARFDMSKNLKQRLAGAESSIGVSTAVSSAGQSLGVKQIYSESPGLEVGWTTYDLQSNCRMNRQVGFNGDDSTLIHFIWMKSVDTGAADRGTGYETWNPNAGAQGAFTHVGTGGGCDIHGYGEGQRSGYVGLDVMPTPDSQGIAVIGNHYNGGEGWAGTVWFDFASNTCFFGPGRRSMPDSTMQYGVDPTWIANNSFRMIWPQTEIQIVGIDTVIHMFAHQAYADDIDDPPVYAYVHYFRHLGMGGSSTDPLWDYPPVIVDTVATISQCVATSHISGTMALVWSANTPDVAGGNESTIYGGIDGQLRDSLGSTQRTNDIYAWVSADMGATFPTPKFNVTDYDSATGGYLVTGDLNAIYDLSDNLHVLYCGRGPTIPVEGDIGDWGDNFYNGRLFHWDQVSDQHRVVKDFRWTWPEEQDTQVCVGGAWNDMWVVRPMLSECENKLYAFFVQFQDMPSGVYDDCAEARWDSDNWPLNNALGPWYGTANGELYVSVSDNNGQNWDVARNLTNTSTPHCVEYEGQLGGDEPVCESDHYVSVSRYGQAMTHPTGHETIPFVDPSDGDYGGNNYIHLTYLNDKFPGSCMQDHGVWTSNPYKWFRVPCVDPVSNPVLVYYPLEVGPPTWTHPGTQIDTTIYMENIGNATLEISSIETPEVNGPPGWLEVSNTGPITIGYSASTIDSVYAYMNYNGIITFTPSVVTGYVILNSNSLQGSVDSIEIILTVADTLMRPEVTDIRTSCLRLAFSNAGSMGNSGASAHGGNGGYNMNYFDDCDDTLNTSGEDDHAGVYLYDASPFIAYIDDAGDTVLNYGMYDATWLSNNGFRPQVSPFADTVSGIYQYGNSGVYYSNDSSIAFESEYYAPLDAEYCDFIVVIQKIYGHGTGKGVRPTFVGDFFDFDIPSDSGSENESGFDTGEKMIYMWGGEYGEDSIAINDCVYADQRYGGVSYYGGYRLPYSGTNDSFPEPRAMWTHINADWVYPNDGFVPGEMYSKISTTYGYSAWSPTVPDDDSVALDLHAVMVFDEFDLGCSSQDTLFFCKIIMSEYDGGEDSLFATKDRAEAWIVANNIFPYPGAVQTGRCCYGDPAAPSCEDVTYEECMAHADMVSWDDDLTCATACPTAPATVPEEEAYLHNLDGYVPGDGDPTGTTWQFVKGTTGETNIASWTDEGDGNLSAGDEVKYGTCDSTLEVVWVGPTIVVTSLDEADTMYLDLIELNDGSFDPLVGPISKDLVEGSWWHEIAPNYCTVWYVQDMQGNFSGYLDSCDYLVIRNGTTWDTVHVIDYATDIILSGGLCLDVCDCEPGNANADPPDGVINIFDITYIISYLYLGGPNPIPYELCSCDANGDCVCNIFDITYIISFLYLGGPDPVTCEAWLTACGAPLRK